MKIDLAAHLGAVIRRVDDREYEGKPARVVVATRDYATDLDDCWDAVTNPERIPRWFLPVTGDLRQGGRYALTGNASGTILVCEKPTTLALTWEFGGGVSWVNVTLSRKSARVTTLELEHIAHPEAHWDRFGAGAVGIGWELGLMGLTLHLESGTAVDGAAVMAWQASDEGKAYIRQSGDAWGEAEATSSGDPADARRRAAATIAFYTGEASA